MTNRVMSPYGLNLIASLLKTALTAAPGSTLHLFTNDIVPTDADLVSTYTEATFDGYAAKTITVLFGPARQPDGSFALYAFQNFVQTGNVTPNQIFGAYLVDPTGALIFSSRFDDAPISMVDQFSTLAVELLYAVPVDGIVGGVEREP